MRALVVSNSRASFTQDIAGLRVDQARGCIIENNRFENTFFAIYLAKARACVVYGNRIDGKAVRETYAGNGIHAWADEADTIVGNRVRGHRDGIYLEFLRGSDVSGNQSEGNLRYGLHFMYARQSRYHDNRFRANGAGVAVMYSSGIEMTDNRFEANWGRGVLLPFTKAQRPSASPRVCDNSTW